MTIEETRLSRAMAGGGWLRALLLCMGVWLHAADSMLVATLMPTAIADIGGLAYISWTLALYVLGSILAGAATGLLAVRLGLRDAMAVAALVYALGCVVSALAPDMAVMLVGRFLQGLGGGWMVALSHVGVTQLFPAPLWPKLLALVSGVWGASSLVGPLIGGLFAEAGYWRGGFWAFALQAVLLAAIIPFVLHRPPRAERAEGSTRLPWGRILCLSAAILLVLWAGVRPEPWQMAVLIAAGIALLALTFRLDSSGRDRLFPRAPLHPGRVWGRGYGMILAMAAATVAFTIYGPLLLETLFGVRPLLAGLMVAMESVAWTVAAILCAGAAPRWERLLIRGGAIAIALSVPGFALAMPDGPVWALLPPALLAGGGFGACWGFVMRRIVESLPETERERAAAAAPTMQILGYAIGAAFAGLAANLCGLDSSAATQEAARQAGFWVFAIFAPAALVGLAAAWWLAPRHPAPAPSPGP